jgi:hypothetical protein
LIQTEISAAQFCPVSFFQSYNSDKPEKYKNISQHTYSGGVLFLVSTNGIRRLQAIDLSLSEQSQKNSAVLSLFSERRNSEELAHRLQETIRTGKCD